MTRLEIKLGAFGAKGGGVWIDGVKIPGVVSLRFAADVNEVPTLDLKLRITGEIDLDVEDVLVRTNTLDPRLEAPEL